MAKQLWTFISYLFHPALMPTLGTLMVLRCDPNFYITFELDRPLLTVLAIVFISTYILPLLLSGMLFKLGRVSSLTQPKENDRRILLAFTALCFILVYYAFHNIPSAGKSLKIFMLGINISIIATLLTSLFTKVSFHSVGVGGLVGTAIGLMRYTKTELYPLLLAVVFIAVLVAVSRYKLKAHDAFNIYVGLIIGIATQALVFFFGVIPLS